MIKSHGSHFWARGKGAIPGVSRRPSRVCLIVFMGVARPGPPNGDRSGRDGGLGVCQIRLQRFQWLVLGSNPAAPTNEINSLAQISNAKSSQKIELGRSWEAKKIFFKAGHLLPAMGPLDGPGRVTGASGFCGLSCAGRSAPTPGRVSVRVNALFSRRCTEQGA
jgi:hypothetical protein